VREKLQACLFKLLPITTHDQLADFFYKILVSSTIQSITSQVGDVRYLPTSNLWGILHHEDSKENKHKNKEKL